MSKKIDLKNKKIYTRDWLEKSLKNFIDDSNVIKAILDDYIVSKFEPIKYNREGRITNLKHCPYCGEIRETSSPSYFCAKAGKNFKSKDLLTTNQLLKQKNEEMVKDLERAFNFGIDMGKVVVYYPEQEFKKLKQKYTKVN